MVESAPPSLYRYHHTRPKTLDSSLKPKFHKPEIGRYYKGARLSRSKSSFLSEYPSVSSSLSSFVSEVSWDNAEENDIYTAKVQRDIHVDKRLERDLKTLEDDRSSVDNEIKSLEKCDKAPLDLVNNKFPWELCTGYALSSNPEASVFFIQIPDFKRDKENGRWKVPQVLVVKATIAIVEELFGLFVADWFEVPTPRVLLIEKFPKSSLMHLELYGEHSQRVGYHWKAIRDTIEKMALEDENYAVQQKVQKDLGSALFYLLMEFMSKAQPLDDLDESMLSDEEGCRKWLYNIGRIVVVDIILNNWDRVPAIWENHGNPSNVLIGTEDDEVYAIDQSVTCIKDKKEQEIYLEKVSHFAQDYQQARYNVDTSPYIQVILNFIKNPFVSQEFAGIERTIALSDHEAKLSIWRGIDASMNKAQNLSLELLQKIKQRVNNMKTGNDNEIANQYWNNAMDKNIDLQFIYHIVQTLQNKG